MKATETTTTAISVVKSDIKKVGNTQYPEDNGMLSICCDLETSNQDGILLRSILTLWGDDIRIIAAEDFHWENGDHGIVYKTNLPFKTVWG